jgi:hypothetical protein
MSRHQAPTRAEIVARGVRIDGLTAVRWIYGVGRTKGYELLRSGALDFKVIRIPGRRESYIVPTSEVLRVLGLQDTSAETAR